MLCIGKTIKSFFLVQEATRGTKYFTFIYTFKIKVFTWRTVMVIEATTNTTVGVF